jgi:dihydroorotate dehydrogenase (fumarate)
MVRYISGLSGSVYRYVLKPFLFKQKPDAIHSRLLHMGAFVQRVPFVPQLIARVWSYQNKPLLEQTVDGITFTNPIGLSAGFDKNIQIPDLLHSVGFGFMTGGSVTHKHCAGNPRPWFYRLPKSKSLVVHVGLANDGANRICQRIHSQPKKWYANFPLIVSVAKTNNLETSDDTEAVADYVGSMAVLRQEDAVDVFEINISCPNTYGGEPFTTPVRLNQLLEAADRLRLQQPVWVKMPINLAWKEFDTLLEVIVRHNVTAVTIGNLSKDRAATTLQDALPNTIKGNLSGLPTQQLSDELIAKTYSAYGDRLKIIGVGGVFTAEDAYRKICLGACLVGLVTGIIFEGPQLIGQMNRELVALLEKDGFRNISQAVGSKNL